MSAVGRRYAKALFELAQERGQTDQVMEDVGALREAWLVSADLREVLKNPVLPKPALRSAVDAVMEKLGTENLVRNTVRLMADRGRLAYLDDVLDGFDELAEQKTGRVRAEVVSARPLPDSYYERLKEQLQRATGQQIVLVKREDPSLIGGVVTRIGDRVFDGSISNRLSELRETLLANGQAT